MSNPEITPYGDSLTGNDEYEGILHRYRGAEHVLLEKHPAHNGAPYIEYAAFSTQYGPDDVREQYTRIFGIPAQVVQEPRRESTSTPIGISSVSGPRGVLIVKQAAFSLAWHEKGVIFHDRAEETARVKIIQKETSFDFRHVALIRALADTGIHNSIQKLF